LLGGAHDGRHVGACAGNQNNDVFHEGRIIPTQIKPSIV
jgi:hypothetical protein